MCIRDRLGTDWAVSTTGVAGPDRQEDKRVGLVYVGLAGPDGARSVELRLTGDRAGIRAAAVDAAHRLQRQRHRGVGATG